MGKIILLILFSINLQAAPLCQDLFAQKPSSKKPAENSPVSIFKKKLNYFTDTAVRRYINIQRVFKVYRTLIKETEGVEILGNWTSSVDVAQKIHSSIQSFDFFYEELGLYKPDHTRIFINDNPLLPHPLGPHCLRGYTNNIWEPKNPDSVIVMDPLGYDTSYLMDESVLFHERTHTLIYKFFNQHEFLKQIPEFEEAIADFLSAHFLDSPVIGSKTQTEAGFYRDISNRKYGYKGTNDSRMETLNQVNTTVLHNRSLFISNMLWSLRTVIGTDNMSHLLPTFFRFLMIYTDEFSRLKEKKLRTQYNNFFGRLSVPLSSGYAIDLEFIGEALIKASEGQDFYPIAKSFVEDYLKNIGVKKTIVLK